MILLGSLWSNNHFQLINPPIHCCIKTRRSLESPSSEVEIDVIQQVSKGPIPLEGGVY